MKLLSLLSKIVCLISVSLPVLGGAEVIPMQPPIASLVEMQTALDLSLAVGKAVTDLDDAITKADTLFGNTFKDFQALPDSSVILPTLKLKYEECLKKAADSLLTASQSLADADNILAALRPNVTAMFNALNQKNWSLAADYADDVLDACDLSSESLAEAMAALGIAQNAVIAARTMIPASR